MGHGAIPLPRQDDGGQAPAVVLFPAPGGAPVAEEPGFVGAGVFVRAFHRPQPQAIQAAAQIAGQVEHEMAVAFRRLKEIPAQSRSA